MSETAPPSAHVVTLGKIADRLLVLDVGCNRCDRRGRLRTVRLIAEYGLNMPLPELRRIIAADCLRMQAGKIHDVCGVHFRGLSTATRGDV